MNLLRDGSGIYTDYYQLTMAQGYFLTGRSNATSCFDYFYRENPFHSGYVIFAGLSDVLEMIEGFTFSDKPANYYYSLAWLSFLSAAAYSIWFLLLQRKGVKVSELNIWKFIIPVFGAILSWVLIPNESPDLVSVAGISITALALILFNRQNKIPLKEPAV